MSNSEISPELKRARYEHIDHRWKQLYELHKDAGQTALQYLFFTNSGGAATTLAFIGAIGATKIGSGVKYSLALFVMGVIFSGISRAKQFHYMDGLFKNWKALVNDYFAGKKSWEQIVALDEAAVGDDKWDYIIGYASFACFIFGSIIGFIALV